MLKRILTVVGILIVGLFSYIYLFNVGPRDVVAYNNLSTPVVSEAFRAGDLVAISPDGQQIRGRICSMDLVAEDLELISLSKRYSNTLRESVPDFALMISWAKNLFISSETPEPPNLSTPQRVSFIGHVSAVKDDGVNPLMSSECACSVAKALLQRENVCTVQKSLVESMLVEGLGDRQDEQSIRERTVGVTFRPSSIVIPDLSALTCPNQQLNTESIAPSKQFDCSRVGGHPPDVFLRAKLGVIQETDLVERIR